jgi:coenzyme F420 biosynthesis associated uncharacterized protein
MSRPLVDWGLAERVSLRVAGAADADAHRPDPSVESASLAGVCDEAERLILAYSQLDPAGELPAPEAVGRAEWARSVLDMLGGLTDELQREQGLELSLPGPLGGIARSVVRVAAGTEVGVASGYAARRVLGQYDISIVGPARPPRLLFVAPNIQNAAGELDVALEPFVRWVTLHETTHAIQFASAPWLREHLGGLVRELLDSAASGVGISDLARRVVSDPRAALSGFLRGDIARTLAGPEQAAILDRIQAAMTVIEGHAEHVMDAAAAEFVPGVEILRERLESRRASRGPLETIIGRILGLDLKLRQYELGKAFCDGVVERGGAGSLNRIWDGPESLPAPDELRRPEAWLERTATSVAGHSATAL